MEKKQSFKEWFNELSKITGNLVTPAHAAKMIGIERQYIEKIVNAGRIKKHYYDEIPFIGMNDINKEIERRKLKNLPKTDDPEILFLIAKKEKLLEKREKLLRLKAEKEKMLSPEYEIQKYMEEEAWKEELEEEIGYLESENDELENNS